ncbi:MAG TPA: uridine kinase [Verrucomicrobiae bacterium]|nr:uridine kinase [Verrucomicrobiae bacterium]
MRPRGPRQAAPILVGIAGGSGSGKSWLAEQLKRRFHPNALNICLDDFYRDRSHLSTARRATINFDHPRAIDWPALEGVLRTLARRLPARCPRYDFKTHSRLPASKRIRPARIILLEGLWVLRRPSIRRLLSLSIFLEASNSVRLARRLARDLANRGRSAESVRLQFRSSVQPMHRQFVQPQKRHADLVFKGAFGQDQIDRIAVVLEGFVASGAPRS